MQSKKNNFILGVQFAALVAMAAVMAFYFFIYRTSHHWLLPYLAILVVIALIYYIVRGVRIFGNGFARVRVPLWAILTFLFCAVISLQYGILEYYDVNFVLGPDTVLRLGRIMGSIGIIYGAYTLGAYLLGHALVRRLLKNDISVFASSVSIVVGFAVISLIGFIFGEIGLFRLDWYLAVLFFICIVRFDEVKSLAKSLSQKRIDISFDHSGLIKIFFWAALALYFSFALLSAYQAMPTDTDSARSYYYAPKLFADVGHTVEFPLDPILQTPKGGEMLYLPLIFFTPYVVNYFTVYVLFLAALVMYFFVKDGIAPSWGVLSSIVLLATPMLQSFWPTLKVDVIVLFIAIALFWALYGYFYRGFHVPLLALGGILLGYAITVKYTFLFLAPFLAIFFIARWREAGFVGFTRWVQHGVLFCAAACAAFSPWMIKNYVTYGNPLQPMFTEINYIVEKYVEETSVLQPEFRRAWYTEFREIDFNKTIHYTPLAILYRSLSGISTRTLALNGPLYLVFLIAIIVRFRRRAVAYILGALFIALWYTFALYNSWYMMLFFPLIIAMSMFSLKSFDRLLRPFAVALILYAALWGMLKQMSFNFGNVGAWSKNFDIRSQSNLHGTYGAEVANFLNTTLREKDPGYRAYAINFVAVFLIDDAHRHLVVDPPNFGISYVYNDTKNIRKVKGFFLRNGIQYMLIYHPLYAKDFLRINELSEYPLYQQDLRMMDELLTTTEYLFSNTAFYVIDLGTHHARDSSPAVSGSGA